MSFKAVIFDLDGTLLDTLEDLCGAANTVLARRGLPVHDLETFKGFIGDGVRVLIQHILPENMRNQETLNLVLKEFVGEYQKQWNNKTKLYEGISELLNALAERQIKLSVLSNKPDDFVQLCVDQYLSNWNFEVVLGQKETIPKKPNPAGALAISEAIEIVPKDCLFVGDTPFDILTALNANMHPVAALWGFRSREELAESGAKTLLEKPQELLELLNV